MEEEFTVSCHCGKLKGSFYCNAEKIWAWDCDCSDCFMRQNTHVVVKNNKFSIQMETGEWEEESILYQWGTKVAIRRFCKTCGVLPWYTPRSNPDSVGITIHCVDWTRKGSREPPRIEIKKFDGVHWEETMKRLEQETIS